MHMRYSELLNGVVHDGTIPEGVATSVAQDSRKVQSGSVFVCVKGETFDGHEYAQKALDMGAGMVVTQRKLGLKNEVVVKDSRKAYSLLCQNFFARPADKMTLIGVTGTNGKTTVSTVLWQVMKSLGIKCGLIGTSVCKIDELSVPAKFTTPEAWDLNALLAQMHKAGCTHVVMEASSQALAQDRLYGLRFELGIFTNLTQDHLDYHGTMENYYRAKKILLTQSENVLINHDDDAGHRLLRELEDGEKYSFSLDDNSANFMARNIVERAADVKFAFLGDGFLHPVKFGMPGAHNVSNALAVAGAAVILGQDAKLVANALGQVKGVSGRSEVLYSGEFTVIRDFAHTGDALEKLLSSLRPHVQGKMIVLFGCAGQRDAAKRTAMGEAATQYADEIFLTADNPREESVQDTMKQCISLLKRRKKAFAVEPQRKKAVQDALKTLKEQDMLLLCGKGHENYQVMDGYTVYLDESEIVAEWLVQNGLLR